MNVEVLQVPPISTTKASALCLPFNPRYAEANFPMILLFAVR